MRFVLSALLALLFVAAFHAYFALDSVIAFVDSPDPILASAKQQGLRAEVVDLSADYIAIEVAKDDSMQPMSVPQLKLIVAQVITDSWLEESVRRSHAALRSAIRGAQADAVLDFRETKAALRTAVEKLREGAAASCVSLWGAQSCADQVESETMIRGFETRALAAIDEIDNQIDLLSGLKAGDRELARELKDDFANFKTIRLMALGLLLVSLALFIALRTTPLVALLFRVGLLGLISSLLYLLSLAVASRFAQAGLAQGARQIGESNAVDARLEHFSGKLAAQLLHDAMSGATMPVALIGVAGFVVVALVFLLSRRSH